MLTLQMVFRNRQLYSSAGVVNGKFSSTLDWLCIRLADYFPVLGISSEFHVRLYKWSAFVYKGMLVLHFNFCLRRCLRSWIKIAYITSQSSNDLYAKNRVNMMLSFCAKEGKPKSIHICISNVKIKLLFWTRYI